MEKGRNNLQTQVNTRELIQGNLRKGLRHGYDLSEFKYYNYI